MRKSVSFVCAAAALAWGTAAADVGFQRLEVPGSPGFAMGLWYPTDAETPAEPNTPFRQALARDADPAGADLPLVLISHGDGGWMGGHAGTALALAEAGYVVAALEHAGNNSEDESASPAAWVRTRPQEISRAIDWLYGDWPGAAQLDPDAIGVFGFSAGGYTALAAVAGAPDFALGAPHCDTHPAEFTGEIGMIAEIGRPAGPEPVTGDPRIGAVVAAAPAFGFAFPEAALAEVGVPVQIWSGADDVRVPHTTNGAPLAVALPGAEAHVVENAGHFAFMAPCNPRLQEINPRIWEMVCVDADGFDRAAFQAEFNRAVIGFLDRAFGRDARR
ncbi:MAG: hypothetical protein AAGC86_05580 [Pseudomonadota bacterium]